MSRTTDIDQFRRTREPDWLALAGLLERARGGRPRLSPDEVAALGRLYRAATSDLALAQRDFPGHAVTAYLNQLVGRAHAVLYRGDPLARRRLWRFIAAGFPQAYRQAWPFILAAALLLLLPALASGLSTALFPDTARWLLPPGVQEVARSLEKGELWIDIPVQERPYASSFIMQNNIRVSFLAFSGGVLAGLPTLWVMFYNGLIVGGLTGLTARYGLGFDLWTFAIGHGVIELSVITMAGGSGLMMGWAVIQPGLLSRRDALVLAARRAVRLIVGCVPLLVAAGLIEGFISPAENIPVLAKWAIGLGSGVLLYLYLLLAGREKRHS